LVFNVSQNSQKNTDPTDLYALDAETHMQKLWISGHCLWANEHTNHIVASFVQLFQVLFKGCASFFHVFFLPSRFAFMFASSQSQKLWHDLRASPGSQKACHHACWPITICFHLETRQSLSIVYNGLKMLVNSHSPGFVRPRLSKDIMLLQIRQSLCVACRRNCSMFVETESNVLDSGSVLERGPLFSWHISHCGVVHTCCMDQMETHANAARIAQNGSLYAVLQMKLEAVSFFSY
jgi:hypothetical protein